MSQRKLYALRENNSGSNSLRESSASCAGLINDNNNSIYANNKPGKLCGPKKEEKQ